MISEEQLEALCIDWFKANGYDHLSGYDIAPDGPSPERSDYRQVILRDRLLDRLKYLNPHIPQDCLEQVVTHLAAAETPILIKNNKAFHQKLLEGVRVEYKAGAKTGPTTSSWWILPISTITSFWW